MFRSEDHLSRANVGAWKHGLDVVRPPVVDRPTATVPTRKTADGKWDVKRAEWDRMDPRTQEKTFHEGMVISD